MQLVAYGAQDIYLTGQPQITFFKSVYRRHTNFALESIQQVIQGTVTLGQRCECTLGRNGDLVLGAHVQLEPGTNATLTAAQNMWSYQNFLLFNRVELEIGGQKVDTIYGDWMVLYAELVDRKGFAVTTSAGAGDGIGSDTLGTTLNNQNTLAAGGSIYVPFLFYFNNNPGLALPLIALQYHEVKFIMHLNTAALLTTNATANTTGAVSNIRASLGTAAEVDTSVANMRLYADYAYLDTTERRKFAQNAHEYLITQHQRIEETTNASTDVNIAISSLNHPVKYIAWRFFVNTDSVYLNCRTYHTGKITLNGSDRMTARPSDYYENMQVHQFWPCGGNQLTFATQGTGPVPDVNSGKWSVYSFALRPAEHQPSGTCNFSRIDQSQLEITTTSVGTNYFTLHAENYNVLRVMSGMGGMAYSN